MDSTLASAPVIAVAEIYAAGWADALASPAPLPVTAEDVRWAEAALLWGRGGDPRDAYDASVFASLDERSAALLTEPSS